MIVCILSSIRIFATLVQFLSEYWELDKLDLFVAGHNDRVAALPDEGHPLTAAQPHDLHWKLQPHVPHHETRAWERFLLNTFLALKQLKPVPEAVTRMLCVSITSPVRQSPAVSTQLRR